MHFAKDTLPNSQAVSTTYNPHKMLTNELGWEAKNSNSNWKIGKTF